MILNRRKSNRSLSIISSNIRSRLEWQEFIWQEESIWDPDAYDFYHDHQRNWPQNLKKHPTVRHPLSNQISGRVMRLILTSKGLMTSCCELHWFPGSFQRVHLLSSPEAPSGLGVNQSGYPFLISFIFKVIRADTIRVWQQDSDHNSWLPLIGPSRANVLTLGADSNQKRWVSGKFADIDRGGWTSRQLYKRHEISLLHLKMSL